MITLIVLMALVTYGPRLLGFVLAGRELSEFWRRFLHFVPVAAFAALTAPALLGSRGEGDIRLLAAALAGLVLWRVRSFWLGILVGMASFWLLRAL